MAQPQINFNDYLGDITSAVSVVLAEGSKDGRQYFYMDVIFTNGYSKRVFLNNDSLFGIKDALSAE